MRFTPTAFVGSQQNNIRLSTTNLIAYYDVNSYNSTDNVWYDISGNNNNAQITGSVLNLVNGQGLLFNGTNNFVNMPSFSGSAALTIILWGNANYNINRNLPSVNHTLFRKGIAPNGWNSYLTQTFTATRDALQTYGQSGTGYVNQGFTGAATGSINFIGYQSTNLTSSALNTGFANASSSLWSGSNNAFGWSNQSTTFGSVLFPYNNPLIFGSGSAGYYNGTAQIIAIYNSLLTNDEMNTQYSLVSSSVSY